MANFSDYFAGFLAEQLASGVSTIGTLDNYKVALFKSGTTSAELAENNTDNELDGMGYDRQDITLKSYTPSTPGTGQFGVSYLANDGEIMFSPATAAWGVITHFAIIADTAGHGEQIVMWGGLNSPQQVNQGDIFKFPDEGIKITLV